MASFLVVEEQMGSVRGVQAEALGLPEYRTGHFSRLRESLRLEDCAMLLVVGTPAVRPEQVARLARAYYYEDPEADRRDECAG